MKTVLIIILVNLLSPTDDARMVHKAFESPQACLTAHANIRASMPVVPSVKVSAFCAEIKDLADED